MLLGASTRGLRGAPPSYTEVVPSCLAGCAAATAHTPPHYAQYLAMWDIVTRAAFVEGRGMRVRESACSSASGRSTCMEGAWRVIVATAVYHRVRVMCPAVGCKKQSCASWLRLAEGMRTPTRTRSSRAHAPQTLDPLRGVLVPCGVRAEALIAGRQAKPLLGRGILPPQLMSHEPSHGQDPTFMRARLLGEKLFATWCAPPPPQCMWLLPQTAELSSPFFRRRCGLLVVEVYHRLAHELPAGGVAELTAISVGLAHVACSGLGNPSWASHDRICSARRARARGTLEKAWSRPFRATSNIMMAG